ncbi:hypothetical protein A2U01_0108175, partial [Trifolium medium]|nr:hypothetical protein [Trifolium medium]
MAVVHPGFSDFFVTEIS